MSVPGVQPAGVTSASTGSKSIPVAWRGVLHPGMVQARVTLSDGRPEAIRAECVDVNGLTAVMVTDVHWRECYRGPPQLEPCLHPGGRDDLVVRGRPLDRTRSNKSPSWLVDHRPRARLWWPRRLGDRWRNPAGRLALVQSLPSPRRGLPASRAESTDDVTPGPRTCLSTYGRPWIWDRTRRPGFHHNIKRPGRSFATSPGELARRRPGAAGSSPAARTSCNPSSIIATTTSRS
jgi:hypothetical protein